MSDLPTGWTVTTLDEVTSINPGIDKSQIPEDAKINFVAMPAVEAESGRIDVSEIREFQKVRTGYTPFLEGDVLFAKITPCMENGKMAVVPHLYHEYGFGSTEFHVLRCPNGVEPRFIYFFVSSERLRRDAQHKMTGAVGQKRVPEAFLEKEPIPLPPSSEQARIVDKIDVLFAELDAGVDSLERAKARLTLYRQSVLKAAFEGRLTADWRAENPDKLEDPEALLKRIHEQRAARHKQELEEWQLKLGEWRAGGEEGRKPAKPRKQKVVESLTGAEIEDLSELPTGWCYTKIAQVAVVGTGVTPLKSNRSFYEPAEVPWVTSGAVNDAFIREPSSMVSQKALDETNLRLYPPHTLLVAMYGEGKTCGKCSELLIEATTNQALAALQVSEAGSHLRAYVKYFFFKNYQDLRRLASGGVQPNLNMGIIENQPFPLCGPEEQAEIVNRLEATLTNIDALEEQIDTDLARAKAMRQSILKRAFSGKLVEQDSSDEPASVLLERIKAEKEEAKKNKRKRKA